MAAVSRGSQCKVTWARSYGSRWRTAPSTSPPTSRALRISSCATTMAANPVRARPSPRRRRPVVSANNALAATPKAMRIPRSRFWFTSVYLKTLRAFRVGILGWGIGFGVVVIATIAAYEAAVSSPAAQAALIATAKAWNWYWEAVGMDTPGGYAMWKLGV